MIKAIHTLIYSDDPEATRAFLRDVLGWPHVSSSTDEPEWLIFRTGPSEMGVHPTHGGHGGREFSIPRHHSISLMCGDIEGTMAALAARGAGFSGPVQDRGFGLCLMLQVPGADDILLYQPQHAEAHGLA